MNFGEKGKNVKVSSLKVLVFNDAVSLTKKSHVDTSKEYNLQGESFSSKQFLKKFCHTATTIAQTLILQGWSF